MNAVRQARWVAVGQTLHPVGLLVALLFFVWSMTPSLLPRPWYLQGVATGISVAIGYGIGCGAAAVLRWCGIRSLVPSRVRTIGWGVLAAVGAVLVPLFLVLGSRWQQNLRELVGLPPAEGSFYILVLLIAVTVAATLLAASRAVRWAVRRLTALINGVVPIPMARLIAVAVAGLVIVLALDGALHRGLLAVAERSAEAADDSTAQGVRRPQVGERSGSPASREDWDSLGREGRTFVAGGPTATQISAVSGSPALTPIRVYAGRESADTVEGVADRVVAELNRTQAFERSVLAVVTTTGRGWVNPNVAAAFEYVTLAIPLSRPCSTPFCPAHCPSSPTVIRQKRPGEPCLTRCTGRGRTYNGTPTSEARGVRGESGIVRRAGRVRFRGRYRQPDRRRALRGHAELRAAVGGDHRRPGSGVVVMLPIVEEGRHIRFASRPEDVRLAGQWGFPRVVYWQHASDPITWWSFDLLLRRPDWLREPLGPDVDPGLRWLPIVTFWQVTLDTYLLKPCAVRIRHALVTLLNSGWTFWTRRIGIRPRPCEFVTH